MTKPRTVADSTDAVHAGTSARQAHHALAPGVAQTATYTFDDTADLIRYMQGDDRDPEREEYGRYGNPTVHELERRLAALDGAPEALAFASGMAAVTTTLLGLLRSGDHVVLFRDCYRRTRQFVTQTLGRLGVEHSLVEPGDLPALDRVITPRTRLIVAESPTNPYLYCTDLRELARIARAHGRVRTLVDATFATPINCRPLELGIDLVVHSATKYLSGHNDVLGGSVAGSAQLLSLVREMRSVLGGVLDPHAAFLVARGLKTLGLRVARQNATALALARALEGTPGVERVWYPGLPSHPSHAIAEASLHGAGGVVSFEVVGGRAGASRVVDAFRLARIAASLGGAETLVEQPAIMSFFELDDAGLAELGIAPGLIRLSVGIEESDAVVQDALQAVAHAVR